MTWVKTMTDTRKFDVSLYSMEAVALFKKNESIYVPIHRRLSQVDSQREFFVR